MAKDEVVERASGASAVIQPAHVALYRRYRPQTPAEVLGQEHVVRALTGAIREDRLHHAFLFCGPRGTGKTSTARILAKMVNCESGPTAEPCGTCAQCVAIRDGGHLDVIEIDAASHGGVEDARELREKAPTAPVQGREKVYIIDEAQRLSREAFDALLKVFEEPPAGVRFVLATTEPHKMPATIVGRCQRFDFRRLTLEALAEHLVHVSEQEGVRLEPSAAHVIARQAEGSARDALSLLDQASVLGDRAVDDEVVRALLGAPHGEIRHGIADAVAVGDAREMFQIVDRLVQDGQDVRNVTGELLTHFRDLLLAQAAPGQDDLLDIPADAYEAVRAQAGKFTPAELARILDLLLAAQNDMRWTTSPRLSLELALVRATMPETDATPQGLAARLERLERLANIAPGMGGEAAPAGEAAVSGSSSAQPDGPPAPEASGSPSPATSPADDAPEVTPQAALAPTDDAPDVTPRATPAPADQAPQAPAAPSAADAGNVDVAMLRRSWAALLDHLGQMRPPQPVLRAFLESATPAAFDGSTLELAFPPNKRFGVQKVMDRQDVLLQALADMFGIRPEVRYEIREQRTPAEADVVLVEEDEVPDEAEAIRRVQEMLGATPREEP
jgi:DNA polymerase-3 subunit gamma/tau